VEVLHNGNVVLKSSSVFLKHLHAKAHILRSCIAS